MFLMNVHTDFEADLVAKLTRPSLRLESGEQFEGPVESDNSQEVHSEYWRKVVDGRGVVALLFRR